MRLWKKVAISLKEIDANLVYNKKYLNINSKEDSQCFYVPVMLIYSIYRKDDNCYPKEFLQKYSFNDY